MIKHQRLVLLSTILPLQVKNGLLLSGQGSTLAADTTVDRFYKGLGSNAPGNALIGGSVDKVAEKNRNAQAQPALGLLGTTRATRVFPPAATAKTVEARVEPRPTTKPTISKDEKIYDRDLLCIPT